MPIAEGSAIPADVEGFVMRDGAPTKVSLGEALGGGKAILFGIPGAFTPTCTNDHLPSFASASAALAEAGIENVVCLSTNDIFVLTTWNKQHGGEHVTMLADGNGDITRALDLGLDGSGLGLGFRTTRFAMVVEGGSVKALSVEESPGSCTVSAAEAILERD